MSKSFTLVHENEFDTLLKSEKGWKKETSPFTKELVYVCHIPWNDDIVVKVYSSVKQNDSLGRGCGQDAIRVCAVNLKTHKGLRKSRRVNRVPGWQHRLKERVVEIWKDLK
jgi:predicted ATP-grasp superfamily ATP-dependent carboligase